MKLAELEPKFIRREQRDGKIVHPFVDTFAEAQGIMFLCPKCFAANNGPIGTHVVICWFRDRGVPDDAIPAPGRWPAAGSGFQDLTLTPSVLLLGGCGWHGFITAGEVT